MKKKKIIYHPDIFLSFQKLFKCLRSKTKLPVMNTYVDVNNNLVLYITLVQLVNLTHLEVKHNTKLFFTPQKFEAHRYLGCSHQPQQKKEPAVHLLKKDLKLKNFRITREGVNWSNHDCSNHDWLKLFLQFETYQNKFL